MVLPLFFNKTRELVTWYPTAADGDMIIAQLAYKFQQGILFEGSDFFLYLFIWAASFVFFWQNYHFWEAIFKIFDHQAYMDRNEA